MDCSSYTELLLSEACGFSGSDIMFSSNETPVQDMKKAYDLGAYINLDDLTHVDFLKNVAGIPETICCRFNPGGTFDLGNGIMDNPGDSKVRHVRRADDRSLYPPDGTGCKELRHPCFPGQQYRYR